MPAIERPNDAHKGGAVTSGDGTSTVKSTGRDDEHKPLPLTSYAILGLLSSTDEYTAVEVKERAHQYIRFFYWTPALSHIRRELNRLEEFGFVTARDVPQGRVKQTLKYRVTEAGEESLRLWAEDGPFDVPVVKNSVLLRLWLGRRAGDKEKVLNFVRTHIARVESDRTELAELIASTMRDEHDPDLSDEALQDAAWSVRVLQHALRSYDDNLESTRELLKDLQQLKLQ